ncbi:hypothetical protein C453_12761 [Haloferax elongans ATCC BAA-1513]|uniref:Uncharacterized protein n=1 Tax=Haloferax elongans ATCC BAA-1513 TaxID=1230453 RepID=M0HL20_HALEO|nr:hypothetical protein [Haloferax elongans]ELZ84417.1 hypothetical protein C453_12761 [Haloferax elongans ATCC BAA-1513]
MDSNTKIERLVEGAAWAVWVGTHRDGECKAVTADTEKDAREKALDSSEYDEVYHVDGPYQNSEPAHFEFTFYTEHRETVVVEAPNEEYAKESADSERTYRGELIQTTHTDVRRVPKERDD